MAMSKLSLLAGFEFRLVPKAECSRKLQKPMETRPNWKKHKLEEKNEGCANELCNLFLFLEGV